MLQCSGLQLVSEKRTAAVSVFTARIQVVLLSTEDGIGSSRQPHEREPPSSYTLTAVQSGTA